MAEVLSDKDLAGWWAFVAESEDSLGKETTLQFLATIAADRREIAELKANQRNEIIRWRNDALEKAAHVCDRWGLDGHGPAHDIRAMLRQGKDEEFIFGKHDAKDREIERLRKVVDAARLIRTKGRTDLISTLLSLSDALAALDN